MSAYEHWQMDASAPELYERYLVPAITFVWANDLLDRISPNRAESVLDVACGTGCVARLVKQRGHTGWSVRLALRPGEARDARLAEKLVSRLKVGQCCSPTAVMTPT